MTIWLLARETRPTRMYGVNELHGMSELRSLAMRSILRILRGLGVEACRLGIASRSFRGFAGTEETVEPVGT